MYCKTQILLLLLAVTFVGKAQTEINNDFKFNDGVYMSLEEFIANTPTYTFDELRIKESLESNFYKIVINKMEVLGEDGKWIRVKRKDIWELAHKGSGYVNLDHMSHSKKKHSLLFYKSPTVGSGFNRLMLIGRICHFSWEGMVSYDSHPNTPLGRPESNVPTMRRRNEARQYMLDLKTGDVMPLEPESLFKFIKDDRELALQFHNEKKRDKKKKLFLLSYLKKYNERNPYFIE